jgi:hypothetical protein
VAPLRTAVHSVLPKMDEALESIVAKFVSTDALSINIDASSPRSTGAYTLLSHRRLTRHVSAWFPSADTVF